MTTHQTSLDADVFGQDLRRRVDRAEAVRERARNLFRALNEERDGEWQPAAIDQADHYAGLALREVHTDRFEDRVELAEEAMDAAEHAFSEVGGRGE